MAVVDVRGVGVDNNDANDDDDDDALLLRVPLGDKTWSGSIAITTESEQKQKREDEGVFGMSEISVHRLGTKFLNPLQISFSKHYHKATNNIGRCSLL